MKVTELKTPIKEPRSRPKHSEDGTRRKLSTKTTTKNAYLQTDSFTNEELNDADKQTWRLVNEIRAMKVALVEYQVKESKWRQEDREWLERKEAELLKKLGEFEEITKRVLKFVRHSDPSSSHSVVPNEGNREVVEKASLQSVASKKTRDGGEGKTVDVSVSDIHLTDSEIYQELREADNKACKTAGEIRAIKLAISEYHEHKENSTWMKEDTFWLEEKQTELMLKLAEFEEVTKRFLRFIGLEYISTTQFVLPGNVLSENKSADIKDEEKSVAGSTLSKDILSSPSNIQEKLKEADEKACKTAGEIREIKNEIANYHNQKENYEPLEEERKWLERKKSELINKLEEFEDITNRVKHLVSLAEVAKTKSLPILSLSMLEPDETPEQVTNGGSWVKFMVEQFFYGLNLVYYP